MMVFMTKSTIFSQILSVLTPFFCKQAHKAFRVHLWPTQAVSSSFDLYSLLVLFIEQLVKCMNLSLMVFTELEYFLEAKRVRPSLKRQMRSGSYELTYTQIRRSNLSPSMRYGLVRYFCTTHARFFGICSSLLTTRIPCPRALAGFNTIETRLDSSTF